MAAKYAVLVDGGFIKRKLQERHRHFPTVAEIQTEVNRIKAHPLLAALSLLRVYFYDAPPASGVAALASPATSAHTSYSSAWVTRARTMSPGLRPVAPLRNA